MAKISELILQLKTYMDRFGDMQVVFKHPDDSVNDILSCGCAKAVNVKDEDINVTWLSGEFVKDDSNPDAKQTSFSSD